MLIFISKDMINSNAWGVDLQPKTRAIFPNLSGPMQHNFRQLA
jgi:hypothetical protein